MPVLDVLDAPASIGPDRFIQVEGLAVGAIPDGVHTQLHVVFEGDLSSGA